MATGRMRGVVAEPEGLRFVHEVLTREQEQALLGRLRELDYSEVVLHGQPARRVVRHYGLSYTFDTRDVAPGDPVPAWLDEARDLAAGLVRGHPEDLVEVLVTRYPPGATIGWHRDAPAFGDVVGLSLASACRMRFQRGRGEQRRVFELDLPPRSGYALTGPARSSWEHSIPAVAEERYSLTFRTVRPRWMPQGSQVAREPDGAQNRRDDLR